MIRVIAYGALVTIIGTTKRVRYNLVKSMPPIYDRVPIPYYTVSHYTSLAPVAVMREPTMSRLYLHFPNFKDFETHQKFNEKYMMPLVTPNMRHDDGKRFNIAWDVLSWHPVMAPSNDVYILRSTIALKSDRYIGSNAAGKPVKFQSDAMI